MNKGGIVEFYPLLGAVYFLSFSILFAREIVLMADNLSEILNVESFILKIVRYR